MQDEKATNRDGRFFRDRCQRAYRSHLYGDMCDVCRDALYCKIKSQILAVCNDEVLEGSVDSVVPKGIECSTFPRW